jgi:hypothetical protein
VHGCDEWPHTVFNVSVACYCTCIREVRVYMSTIICIVLQLPVVLVSLFPSTKTYFGDISGYWSWFAYATAHRTLRGDVYNATNRKSGDRFTQISWCETHLLVSTYLGVHSHSGRYCIEAYWSTQQLFNWGMISVVLFT